MAVTKYTVEQKNELVRYVDDKRSSGLSLRDACEQAAKWNGFKGSKAGSVLSLYTWWKAKQGGRAYADRSRKPKRVIAPTGQELDRLLGPIKVQLSDEPKSGHVSSDKKALAERTLALLERVWKEVDNSGN